MYYRLTLSLFSLAITSAAPAPRLSTGRAKNRMTGQVRHQHISPSTCSSLPTTIVVSYYQRPTGHPSFHAYTTTSLIEVSWSQKTHAQNSLPSYSHLRQDMSYERFKRQLKTFLFGNYSITARSLFSCALEVVLLTYMHCVHKKSQQIFSINLFRTDEIL